MGSEMCIRDSITLVQKLFGKEIENIITMDLIKLSISLAKISLLSHIRIM